MRRTLTIAVALILLVSAWLYVDARIQRYEVVSGGQGNAYRLDHWTGQVHHLYYETATRVSGAESSEPTAEKAIALAKTWKLLNHYQTNEEFIAGWVRQMSGPFEILGWRADPEDVSPNGTFLVSFTVVDSSGSHGYFFEVNTEVPLVRRASHDEDPELARHYGLARPEQQD